MRFYSEVRNILTSIKEETKGITIKWCSEEKTELHFTNKKAYNYVIEEYDNKLSKNKDYFTICDNVEYHQVYLIKEY